MIRPPPSASQPPLRTSDGGRTPSGAAPAVIHAELIAPTAEAAAQGCDGFIVTSELLTLGQITRLRDYWRDNAEKHRIGDKFEV